MYYDLKQNDRTVRDIQDIAIVSCFRLRRPQYKSQRLIIRKVTPLGKSPAEALNGIGISWIKTENVYPESRTLGS